MNQLARWMGRIMAAAVLVGLMDSAVQAAWEGNLSSGVLSGRIASIDPQENLLTVRTGLFAKKSFIIGEASKISNGVKEMKLEDLKPGDVVNLSFDSEGGKQVVRSLIVGSAIATDGGVPWTEKSWEP